jgi:hypothetical protein
VQKLNLAVLTAQSQGQGTVDEDDLSLTKLRNSGDSSTLKLINVCELFASPCFLYHVFDRIFCVCVTGMHQD